VQASHHIFLPGETGAPRPLPSLTAELFSPQCCFFLESDSVSSYSSKLWATTAAPGFGIASLSSLHDVITFLPNSSTAVVPADTYFWLFLLFRCRYLPSFLPSSTTFPSWLPFLSLPHCRRDPFCEVAEINAIPFASSSYPSMNCGPFSPFSVLFRRPLPRATRKARC